MVDHHAMTGMVEDRLYAKQIFTCVKGRSRLYASTFVWVYKVKFLSQITIGVFMVFTWALISMIYTSIG